MSRCVEIVSRSKKPLILLGSQATLPPTPVEDLRRSLENLGIPCYLGGMSRGLLGEWHIASPLSIERIITTRIDGFQECAVHLLIFNCLWSITDKNCCVCFCPQEGRVPYRWDRREEMHWRKLTVSSWLVLCVISGFPMAGCWGAEPRSLPSTGIRMICTR